MGVQRFAAMRNAQVEYFIHFVLDRFFSDLERLGQISNCELVVQKPYSSDIASDVWDHFLSATQPNGRLLEIWCQTTCYKGNGTGKPEPNKTYEVRETLVEGLSIRGHFGSSSNTDYRTIHFTVGDSRYTYQWFMAMKAAVFDLSIYIGEPDYDIFAEIDECLSGAITEGDKFSRFRSQLAVGSRLCHQLDDVNSLLSNWWESGFPHSAISDSQWELVKNDRESNANSWPNFDSLNGTDIKGRVNQLVFSEEPDFTDPLISRTAAKLLSRNPFLASAVEVLSSWEQFISNLEEQSRSTPSIEAYLKQLWLTPLPERLVVRRLLVRIHSDEAVSYIQDRDVDGITEHNMYNGEHSELQVTLLCSQIKQDLFSQGIRSATDLSSELRRKGKRLLNQARWFEARNGTQLKPSFDYVILALRDAGFTVCKPQEAGIRPIGYHAEISNENVRPYTNLKAVLAPSGELLCLLKAKFFREPEFPRRCKEESFVGLTLKYHLEGEHFERRFTVPLIMFVDMAIDYCPPPYALKRLISFGWKTVFSPKELIDLLNSFGE